MHRSGHRTGGTAAAALLLALASGSPALAVAETPPPDVVVVDDDRCWADDLVGDDSGSGSHGADDPVGDDSGSDTAGAYVEQDAVPGSGPVTLDGSDLAVAGEDTVTWCQLYDDSDPRVVLTDATLPVATFEAPETFEKLEFLLTVERADGETVTRVHEVEAVSAGPVITRAEYDAEDGEWRVEGTAPAGATVVVTTGSGTGPELGRVVADVFGAWRFRSDRDGLPRPVDGVVVATDEATGRSDDSGVEIDD